MDNLSELLQPSGFKFYCPEPKPAISVRRDSPEQLLRALNKAHTNIRQIVAEKDQLKAASLALYKRQRLQFRIFLGVMGLTWSIVGWALKFLIPYAIHGMAK